MEPFIGLEKVSEITGYSKSQLYKFVFHKKIPVHRIPNGAKLLFLESEIIEWIKNGIKQNNNLI